MLTAAHCFDKGTTNGKIFLVTGQKIYFNKNNITIHSNYEEGIIEYDIALISLDNSVQGTSYLKVQKKSGHLRNPSLIALDSKKNFNFRSKNFQEHMQRVRVGLELKQNECRIRQDLIESIYCVYLNTNFATDGDSGKKKILSYDLLFNHFFKLFLRGTAGTS